MDSPTQNVLKSSTTTSSSNLNNLSSRSSSSRNEGNKQNSRKLESRTPATAVRFNDDETNETVCADKIAAAAAATKTTSSSRINSSTAMPILESNAVQTQQTVGTIFKQPDQLISLSPASKATTKSCCRVSKTQATCSKTSAIGASSQRANIKRKYEYYKSPIYQHADHDSSDDEESAAPAPKRQQFSYEVEEDTDTSSPAPRVVDILKEHISFPICNEMLPDESPALDDDDDEVNDADTASSENANSQQRELPPPYDVEEALLNVLSPPDDDDAVNNVELTRPCPLPALSWANAAEVWRNLCISDREHAALRDSNLMAQHPELKARMRAVMLDWMLDVCGAHGLHRETYYLAIDYLDRYLTSMRDIKKTFLQLIGVTCLFLASKVEEIYPPRLSDFVDTTAKAFTAADILRQETVLLQVLEWQVNPITPIAWLGIYMQLKVCNHVPTALSAAAGHGGPDVDRAFLYKQFSALEFVHTTQLLDLCTYDLKIADFPNSVLAAAAMSHTYSPPVAIAVSGLQWEDICECFAWMQPFYDVILKDGAALNIRLYENNELTDTNMFTHLDPHICLDENYLLQSYDVNLHLLDKAYLYQQEQLAKRHRELQKSPRVKRSAKSVLTPPPSGGKAADAADTNADADADAAAGVTANATSAEAAQVEAEVGAN